MHPRRSRVADRKPIHEARDARSVAFEVLSDYALGGRFVSRLLEERLAQTPDFPAEERRLAVEMINGVVRRRVTLDTLLAPHVKRSRDQVEGELWTLLQLGAYQLVLLDAIPSYAAVSQTVALAKTTGRRGWDGFVNGVLRSVQRLLSDQFTDNPAADALPTAQGRYRRLATPIFPDPATDPAGYLAKAFSFPRWLIERWSRRFDFNELCRLGFWFDKPAPFCLRVNTLRADRDRVMRLLTEHGIPAAAGGISESIRLDGPVAVKGIPGFAEGLFSVQDESAMLAVDLLAPQPGESVLDLCAAPGMKTCHIAERMGDVGALVATDIRSDRLARIEENCRRLGLSIVRKSLCSPDGSDMPSGPFDAILVDAPCSNSGVLGKRPEARWRIDLRELADLSELQLQLLKRACSRLKPGGRVVYSTCSIESEENEAVTRRALQTLPGLTLVSARLLIPGKPADGGYQALFRYEYRS